MRDKTLFLHDVLRQPDCRVIHQVCHAHMLRLVDAREHEGGVQLLQVRHRWSYFR